MSKPKSSRTRNNLRLAYQDDTGNWLISHFVLREFENSQGWVMIDARVIRSLEHIRSELTRMLGETVEIIITDSTRTISELNQLAKQLGWSDSGGWVARNSRHLETFGGIAVDFYARIQRTRQRVKSDFVATVARKYFPFVKADYPDGHIHADWRD